MSENTKIDRREALKVIAVAAGLPLVPRRRTGALVPQPKRGVDLNFIGWTCGVHHHQGWKCRLDCDVSPNLVMDVSQGYDTTFWDVPEWADDYELIDGVWCWV